MVNIENKHLGMNHEPDKRKPVLSPLQRQILELKIKGKEQDDIARELHLTARQIKRSTYGENGLFERLEVSTLASAVANAYRSQDIDVNALTKGRDLSPVFTLTPDEVDVMIELTADFANTTETVIGKNLDLARNAVQKTITQASQKLGASSRAVAQILFLAASQNLEVLEDQLEEQPEDREEDTLEESKKDNVNIFSQLYPAELRLLEEVINNNRDNSSNKELAQRLGLSVKTINNTITRINRKLGTRNKTQVAFTYYSMRNGEIKKN